MKNALENIPRDLKTETITALQRIYSLLLTREVLQLQEDFQPYEDMIQRDLLDYADRHPAGVSEIDIILEEERAKARVGQRHPLSIPLMDKFRALAIQRRKLEFSVKQSFLAKSGTPEQFELLKQAVDGRRGPWWGIAPT